MKHPKKLDTNEVVSQRMSKVHLKKGKAETILAKELWKRGIRYRLNYKKLFGSPDIAITKSKIAVFVDGEFWHGFDWENRKTRLKSNKDYWVAKIEENMARDMRNDKLLINMGWTPVHFWEKEVLKETEKCVSEVMERVYDLNNELDDVHMDNQDKIKRYKSLTRGYV